MTSRHSVGDGDTCPLDADHGPMVVLRSKGAPVQFCSHADHDGRWLPVRTEPTRCKWPLHGFEESVAAHKARRARDARELPDLSGLLTEVK